MLLEHFGLQILPFENVPDPLFFFDHGDYGRIYKRIISSMEAGRGLMLITGPVGSGKTTLSQKLIFDFSKDISVLIWMAEPPATTSDLFMFIAQELGINSSLSKNVFVLRDIRKTLLKVKAQDKKYLMIMDESHLVSDEVLNGMRLLNNLEDGPVKLIQILIMGQSELLDIINRTEMEFFKQRINTIEILGKMDTPRTFEYISHRIQIAGGLPSIFSDSSLEAISIASNGIPRKINSLCNMSLNMSYERGKKTVDVQEVYEVAKDMGLGREIFHYMLEIKHQEKKIQAEAEKKTQLPEDSEQTIEKENSHQIENDLPDDSPVETINGNAEEIPLEDSPLITIERNVSVQRDLESINIDKQDMQRNLKTPVLILLMSLVTFILSVFFYGYKSGCPDFLTCLGRLLGIV